MLRQGMQRSIGQLHLEWTHLNAVVETLWKARVLSEDTYRGVRRTLAAIKAQL
jgi:hypothetical protein